MRTIVGAARYMVLIAVVMCLVVTAALLFFGSAAGFGVIRDTLLAGDFSNKAAKKLLVSAIEIVDIFLLATVVYIIAIGLYELFIDDTVAVPKWLEIHNLDDLKDKLVGVVVVVLAVGFLGQFVSWDGQTNLLVSGGGTALLIAALTAFLYFKPKK